MQHLDSERLAALDDDTPTPEELAHLSACMPCRQERAAFERLARLASANASELRESEPRLTSWPALSAELRANGLLTRPSEDPERADSDVQKVRVRRRYTGVLRMAAALALMTGGAVVGRASAGASLFRAPGAVATAISNVNGSEFESAADASDVLARAQRDYQRASLWLAAHDTTVNAQAVYRARLSALEQMMVASRAALYEAPQDPLLNQYYLAAYTAREATLRQLGASLPVDRVMESF